MHYCTHVNAQSCANAETFDEIKSFLDKFKNEINIIVISETWLKTDQLCLYNLCGYASMHSCREHKRGGGLLIFVKEPCDIAKIKTHNTTWNIMSMNLRNYRGMRSLNLCGMYRPPKKENLKNYFKKSSTLLTPQTVINC